MWPGGAATLAAMAPPRPADPGDVIRAQVVLEEHDVAPDGSFAVVVRRIVERNGYVSHLWLVPLERPGDRHAAAAHDRARPRQPAADLARRPARRVPAAACRRTTEPASSLRVLDLDGGRARAA